MLCFKTYWSRNIDRIEKTSGPLILVLNPEIKTKLFNLGRDLGREALASVFLSYFQKKLSHWGGGRGVGTCFRCALSHTDR